MALIIKGTMPTCCGLCCECLGGGSDAYYCNRAKRQISDVVPPYDKRMEWCPIIGEIPDRHGRLIDADAEIAKLEAFMKVLNKETESGGRQYHECDCVLHYLTDAPTIVEASE